jgi:pSer/pThr/pTyr-binding forkhead associated (FHA) protein
MRIEILVDGSEEPQIYPINKQKLVLGSGETCDVIIPSEQISRKHLIIAAEGDSYFVIDQGSTNGSFIN